MERTIERKFEFGATEVRDAILARMRELDMPAPASMEGVKFKLTDGGASLEWVEQCEINF